MRGALKLRSLVTYRDFHQGVFDMSERKNYSALQIGLHWLVTILVLAAWLTADGMGRALRQKLEAGSDAWPVHVWLGLAILATMVIRLVVRLASGTPGETPETGEAEAILRHWGHILLYVLLFAVPIGGSVAWFLKNRDVGDMHGLAGNALFFIAGAHAVIALWHHYIRKDGTLARMLTPS